MLELSEPRPNSPSDPDRRSRIDFRLVAAVLLLGAATAFTFFTIDALSSRRKLRTDLAEISHARYDLLNASRWVETITPVLESKIDAIDLKAANQASLRPIVQNALYRLLADIEAKMAVKSPQSTGVGGLLGQRNQFLANMMVAALRPHVPEYADVVLAELGKPETRNAVKKYLAGALAEGAKNTFGVVDMRLLSSILKQYGCNDVSACQQELGDRLRALDARITYRWLAVLTASAAAFVLLLTGKPRRSTTLVLLLFCVVLLIGGVFTPMIEVEAKISHARMTFLGSPIAFSEQVLYFQSKSLLEVFRALIETGRPDMWVVAVLVLMFSVVFPILKLIASALYLYKPGVLGANRVARFFALESSKWSMADVMALAIFMAFVAFDGLIPNTMAELQASGADLAIPTDSSKILPGYHLFVAFCLASLLLSKRLARGIEAAASSSN